MTRAHAVVVGGGFAGLAAASGLARGGWAVTLLEATGYLGGRAFSFFDPRSGMWLDNGQHVLLGVCETTPRWLDSLGVEQAVFFQPRLDLPVFARHRWSRLTSRPWPGPLHLLPGLAGFRLLSPRARWRAARAAAALVGRRGVSPQLTFREWLRRMGQGPEAERHLWDLMGTAVLNLRAAEADAALAVQALGMVIAAGWPGARIGFFRQPLGHTAAAVGQALRRLGVTVALRQRVAAVVVAGDQVRGVRLADGTLLEAEAVVLAVPFDRARSLIPPDVADASWSDLDAWEWSPIYNLYLWFDRPVAAEPVWARTEGVVQFVFDRGQILDLAGWAGRHWAVSVSAADPYRSWSSERLVNTILAELTEAVPAFGVASLLYHRGVWQPRATFRATPAAVAARPSFATAVRGLWRAGDWTATGWPACIEGAIRSGLAVAAAVAKMEGEGLAPVLVDRPKPRPSATRAEPRWGSH
ncbi:MAG: hydroxysqualene dehydroxylase HpnE [Firmicutes bacterium]|nr:FAD-dependent oxidoreductase [Alicyclobacillaceae bacterium]MCL6498069.1 hydroxysqualene dehydroxylase HpnE [Bacillota bacterium]